MGNRSLYSRPGMAALPGFIQAAHDRDAAALQPLVARVSRGFLSMSIGVMAAVECRDRATWRTSDGAAYLVSASNGGLCAGWSALGPPVLIAKDTAVPTLVLSGYEDPITPPVFAREAATTLGAGAKLVPFAHVGHGVEESSACGETTVSAFIRTGSIDGLDTACAAAVPPLVFR